MRIITLNNLKLRLVLNKWGLNWILILFYISSLKFVYIGDLDIKYIIRTLADSDDLNVAMIPGQLPHAICNIMYLRWKIFFFKKDL